MKFACQALEIFTRQHSYHFVPFLPVLRMYYYFDSNKQTTFVVYVSLVSGYEEFISNKKNENTICKIFKEAVFSHDASKTE